MACAIGATLNTHKQYKISPLNRTLAPCRQAPPTASSKTLYLNRLYTSQLTATQWGTLGNRKWLSRLWHLLRPSIASTGSRKSYTLKQPQIDQFLLNVASLNSGYYNYYKCYIQRTKKCPHSKEWYRKWHDYLTDFMKRQKKDYREQRLLIDKAVVHEQQQQQQNDKQTITINSDEYKWRLWQTITSRMV